MKRALLPLLAAALLLSCLSGCTDTVIGASRDGGTGGQTGAVISLNGDSASYPGGGVAVNGSVVTISAPGEYTLRGSLDDGRILVDTGENPGDVILILDGADICCLTDSAIYVAQAKNVDIVLAAGSSNRVTSGTEADMAAHNELSQGAAIYAEDDLDIKGEGALEVCGYLNNGIACKDDLDIMGGSISVLAANNGLRGSESVCISGGALAVTAMNDGIKSTSAQKAGKGYVELSGGSVTISCYGDGVSAETELRISGGELTVETQGDPLLLSCKGIKAKTGLSISGGTLAIHAADHAIRSQAALTVSGGKITAVSSAGKGLAAATELNISDGVLEVRAMDDGVASDTALLIGGGTLTVVAGADGLKAGSKSSGFGAAVGDVTISGGTILVSAAGDPVDAKATLLVNGGSILAAGSSKRVKGFDSASTQSFLASSFSGAAGSSLSVSDEAGRELLSLTAEYAFNSVLCSCPELSAGSSYLLSAGSSTVRAAA